MRTGLTYWAACGLLGVAEGYGDVGMPEELLEQGWVHALTEEQTEEAA